MNVLVTGGNGQLGCSLRKVAGMYPQHRFVFTDVPEADITDRACIAALAEKHAIDLIVNCAAYTAVDRAESDAETAAKINVQGPEVLAGVARRGELSSAEGRPSDRAAGRLRPHETGRRTGDRSERVQCLRDSYRMALLGVRE